MNTNSRPGISVASLICLIAAIALALSAVLPCHVWPFSDSLTVSRAMTDGTEGMVVIGIGIAAALCSAVAMITGLKKLNIASLAAGCIGVIVFIMENVGVEQKLKSLAGDYDWLASLLLIGNKLTLKHGPGFYLLLAASLALIVFGTLGLLEQKRVSSR